MSNACGKVPTSVTSLSAIASSHRTVLALHRRPDGDDGRLCLYIRSRACMKGLFNGEEWYDEVSVAWAIVCCVVEAACG